MAIFEDILIEEIRKRCGENQSVEDFINDWIRSGETFSSLYQFFLSQGVQTNRNSVWKTFRPLLNIPYLYKNQFRYKWEAIAKSKGFRSAKDMIVTWKEQGHNKARIAEELGIFPNRVTSVIEGILQEGRTFKSDRDYKHLKSRDDHGFSRRDSIDKWNERLKDLGFKDFSEAIERMQGMGLNYSEMAKTLGISVRAFRWRRRRKKEME